jgi:hypothetical protein
MKNDDHNPNHQPQADQAGGKGTQGEAATERPYFVSLRQFGVDLCEDVVIARTSALLGEIAGYYVTRRAIEVVQTDPYGGNPDAIAKAIFPRVAKELQVDAQKYIVTHFHGRN